MPEKEAGKPAAHLVVAQLAAMLDPVVVHVLKGLVEARLVDPVGHVPVFLGDNLYHTCQFPSSLFFFLYN